MVGQSLVTKYSQYILRKVALLQPYLGFSWDYFKGMEETKSIRRNFHSDNCIHFDR
jgi:hypothetical protein